MQIMWGRIMLTSAIIVALANIFFILFLAALAPENDQNAYQFAATHRLWVNPLMNTLFTFLGAYFNGRLLFKYQVRNGFTLGLFVVIVDLLLSLFGELSFNLLFIASNTLIILSGLAGGWCSKSSDPRNS